MRNVFKKFIGEMKKSESGRKEHYVQRHGDKLYIFNGHVGVRVGTAEYLQFFTTEGYPLLEDGKQATINKKEGVSVGDVQTDAIKRCFEKCFSDEEYVTAADTGLIEDSADCERRLIKAGEELLLVNRRYYDCIRAIDPCMTMRAGETIAPLHIANAYCDAMILPIRPPETDCIYTKVKKALSE